MNISSRFSRFSDRASILLLILLFLPLPGLNSQSYPAIHGTSIFSDSLYRQHQDSLNQSQPLLVRLNSTREGKEREELKKLFINRLLFFTYTPLESDTIYTVAADFMVTPDTLASLNGLERASYFDFSAPLIIPTLPGLYIPSSGGNELDRRLRENHSSDTLSYPVVINREDNKNAYTYYPNGSFTPNERLYFISLPFRSPLDHDWDITSSYGNRVNPMTGDWEFHKGLDVRAPVGTPVYAMENGTIIETTELDNYGIIIILKHKGGYETRYAHLNNVYVKKGDSVKRGQMIGRSGNTGISTGPHLHFEIRLWGKTINPEKLVAQGSA